MKLIPCKHIDHNPENYPSCELKTDDDYPSLKYFKRTLITEGDPVNVQFCGKGRGRINSILDCYGDMHCYEAKNG